MEGVLDMFLKSVAIFKCQGVLSGELCQVLLQSLNSHYAEWKEYILLDADRAPADRENVGYEIASLLLNCGRFLPCQQDVSGSAASSACVKTTEFGTVGPTSFNAISVSRIRCPFSNKLLDPESCSWAYYQPCPIRTSLTARRTDISYIDLEEIVVYADLRRLEELRNTFATAQSNVWAKRRRINALTASDTAVQKLTRKVDAFKGPMCFKPGMASELIKYSVLAETVHQLLAAE
ncbi:protein ORF62 [Anguillid herpesvirus 1]|uniref:Protein ORF62 n=1 Tax=Anguillid herpesvirus 1 TaxID=150286 RepID=A0A1J0REB8_9VIRU|nr:protein ORF62 [Anguillid herpesvirus 1]ADA57825.1 protein ORF62 [Anguillid herpesvirus 1]APD76225.1 ORF62 [Anguillid herpesvirus 1]QRM16356.1 protein ORF62 [Anguillid herpesvirus 1]QRM16485.1 protein ORF62 [Anguillid herpesvirus 1]QRM16615.1 protein ORF62 [Anguillid herpesvirus 1]